MEHTDFLRQIAPPLLDWYARCGRALPWRESRDPYRVWVSEIMLQQTRVDTVIPYYRRFLEQLPDVPALAEAAEEKLLKLWEGLGYYSRARSMQKAARVAVARYGGRLPDSLEALRELPGIGEYTAGAVGSIAFGLPVPAVDGNVLRVISRILNAPEDVADPAVKKKITSLLSEVIAQECSTDPADVGYVGNFNQALMDLGATVCLPGGEPRCLLCPLRSLCRGFAAGTAGELPVKAAKAPRRVAERTVFVLTCGDRLALRKRPAGGLLGGLWELPGAEAALTPQQAKEALTAWGIACPGGPRKLKSAKHIFTHVEWRMTVYGGEAAKPSPGLVWATAAQLREEFMLPSAFLKIAAVKDFMAK